MPTEVRKFQMGKLVWTRGVDDRSAEDTEFSKLVVASLKRHAACDWGRSAGRTRRKTSFL